MSAIPPIADIEHTGSGCFVAQVWGQLLHRLIIIALVLASALACKQAAAQEAIGSVSRIQGEASATRSGVTRTLGFNAPVILNETVSTGPAARLEVIFKDNTRLTLGENARLTLNRYVYNPLAGRGTIRFRIAGAFRFVSGQLSKLARSDVSVRTPVATIGIRGTEFWGGPIEGKYGVLLLGGEIVVSNKAGSVTLSKIGQGTTSPRPSIRLVRSRPGPPARLPTPSPP